MMFKTQKAKLGILAEKSLIHKKLKLNIWKNVNRYWEKSYFPVGKYGVKLFNEEKYETIELYHSSIQNDQVQSS